MFHVKHLYIAEENSTDTVLDISRETSNTLRASLLQLPVGVHSPNVSRETFQTLISIYLKHQIIIPHLAMFHVKHSFAET